MDNQRKRKYLRDYGLTLVLSVLFLISIVGQVLTGFESYNQERESRHLQPLESRTSYLRSGHFVSSVGENMESEFLQMGLYVLLTAALYQVGSAESRKPPEEMDEEDRQDENKEELYCREKRKQSPILWRLYENSLSIALFSLFILSFFVHAYGSRKIINEQNAVIGEPAIGFWGVFTTSDFWFESFQNWQSEFFSIAAIVLLSVFLRQKGSPQSKKLTDPNWKTGDE